MVDLGFTASARYDEICSRAVALGFGLLPAESGPLLRLALERQPKNDAFAVATEPLIDENGEAWLFSIGHSWEGTKWLDVRRCGPDYPVWPGHYMDSFAFGGAA